MEKESAFSKFKKRPLDSHKGDYGHVLVIGGSLGMTGAVCLAAMAALRSGSGMVTLAAPKSLNAILEAKLTEVITKPVPETDEQSLAMAALPLLLQLAQKKDAVAIGPGLSLNVDIRNLVPRLVLFLDMPMVIDADGLNALSEKPEVLEKKKADIIITPHLGEMSRLTRMEIGEIKNKREKVAGEFAKKYKIVVVLKGYQSVVASPDGKIHINKTGNPGMATAGCGDVLTGITAALLGQKLEPFLAAKLAVYLHGLAGDLAAQEKGEVSLIAGDIIDKLPEAIKRLKV